MQAVGAGHSPETAIALVDALVGAGADVNLPDGASPPAAIPPCPLGL